MSINSIISRCAELKVKLKCQDGQLKISAPKGAISKDLLQQIKLKKEELISFLSEGDSERLKLKKNTFEATGGVLSSGQQQMWFLENSSSLNDKYQFYRILRISGELDLNHIEGAFKHLLFRHTALRSCYRQTEDELQQNIIGHDEFSLEVFNLREKFNSDELEKIESNFKQVRFDLTKDYMLKVMLVVLPDNHCRLHIKAHHIATDGWSIGLIVKEFVENYKSLSQGINLRQNLPYQYYDYVNLQQTDQYKHSVSNNLNYFTDYLKGAPSCHSLSNETRTNTKISQVKHLNTFLPHDLLKLISEYCQSQNISQFSLFQFCVSFVIARYSNSQDVVMGVPMANRELQELTDTVGYFVNTVPIRTRISSSEKAINQLKKHQNQILEVMERQNVPLERIVEQVVEQRIDGVSPLVQIIFSYQNNEIPQLLLGQASIEVEVPDSDYTDVDLTIDCTDENGQFSVNWSYALDILPVELIRAMSESLECLLLEIVTRPNTKLNQLKLLSDKDSDLLLGQLSKSTELKTSSEPVYRLFEEQAQKTPNNIAVIYQQSQLTYLELNEKANQLAHYMRRELQIKPGDHIGILAQRSIEMSIIMLAIHKAGAVFLIIDPQSPVDRIKYLIEDASLALLFSSLDEKSKIELLDITHISISHLLSGSSLGKKINEEPVTNIRLLPEELNQNSLAYIIYTSGSTGNPKGVMVEHQNLTNYVQVNTNQYCMPSLEGSLVFTSMNFDLSLPSFYIPLVNGLFVEFIGDEGVFDSRVKEVMISRSNRLLRLTPSHLTILLDILESEEVTGNHVFVVGGEALEPKLAKKALTQCENSAVFNHYGPSESTIGCTLYALEGDVNENVNSIPIGFPMPNSHIYILDQEKQLTPLGVIGELYIGGKGVTRGYLNNELLTKEKFIKKTFATEGTKSHYLYKTGDLARFLPCGAIEFVGRIDDQIKIRGYRIELGEIESKLAGISGVDSAVVLLANDKGIEQLKAFVRPSGLIEDSERQKFSEDILKALSSQVLEYMIPQSLTFVEGWPLSANGKLNRAQLLRLSTENLERDFAQPENEIERTLVEVCADLLNLPVESISMTQSFFSLGGHSLLTIRLMAELRKHCELELSIEDIFNASSLRNLVELADNNKGNLKQKIIALSDSRNLLPVSFSQQRLWLLDKLQGGSIEYNMPLVFKIEGSVNILLIGKVLEEIIARHEVLRTVFVEANGELHQSIRPMSEIDFKIKKIDFTSIPQDKLNQAIKDYLFESVSQPFNLSTDLMIRSDYVQTAEDSGVLIFNMHHIATDGWSGEVLTKEFLAIYSAYFNGQVSPIPPLEIQYGDYAIWQREQLEGDVLDKQLDYWVSHLEGAPSVHNLPLSNARIQNLNLDGDVLNHCYSSEVAQGLFHLAKKHNLTPFMLLHGAVCLLLSKHSNTDDIVVGTPVANRMQSELKSLIGFFVNTYVLRVSTNFETLNDFFKSLRKIHIDALSNQDAPFEKVVERLNVPRNNGYSPLFQIMVKTTPKFGIEQHNVLEKFSLPNISVEYFDMDFNPAMFEIEIDFTVGEDSLGINWTYNKNLFSRSYIELLNSQLEVLLEGFSHLNSEVDMPLDSLQLQSKAQQKELLHEILNAENNEPHNQLIHQLFEEQVKQTPNGVALNFNGKTLTYQQLNQRANQVSNYLIDHYQVSQGNLVGVCINRSHDMIIAIIAILKCGAAYVPLDPNHPKERLAYIVKDACLAVVLGDIITSNIVRNFETEFVDLSEAQLFDSCCNKAPDIKYTQDDINSLAAYVIYTSGSTGRPKGVVQTHHTIMNLVANTVDRNCARLTLQFTPYSFDVSVQEIMSTLLSGSTLRQITQDQKDDLLELASLISRENIERIFVPPAAFSILAEQWVSSNANLSLTQINVAGEKFVMSQSIRRLLETFPACEVINQYGPTETHVVTQQVVSGDIGDDVPIGYAVDNCYLFILDKNFNLVEKGGVGELYVGGAHLALRYLNQPKLTTERFINNPFMDERSQKLAPRLYRTGDLVRLLPSGQLNYIGRSDNQVKVRGFRVELGEIESQIMNQNEVDSSIVTSKDFAGVTQLVAYVKPAFNVSEDTSVFIKNVKKALSFNLPDYMIPTFIVLVDDWVLTNNGKIDRRKLPEIDEHSISESFVEAKTREEYALLETIGSLLNQEATKISVNSSFFEIGGHSLLVPRVITLLQNKGYQLKAPHFYSAQTLSELARLLVPIEKEQLETFSISKVPENATQVTPAMFDLVHLKSKDIEDIVTSVPGHEKNIKDILPLLPMQQGLLFQHLMNPEQDPFWQNIFVKVKRQYIPLMLDSINEIVKRHDALRSLYVPLMPSAVSVVLRAHNVCVEQKTLDMHHSPLEQLKSLPVNMVLDTSPPIKVIIGRIESDDFCYIRIISHHLTLDEAGASIVLGEILRLMENTGKILPLPSPYRALLSHVIEKTRDTSAKQFFRDKFEGIKDFSPVLGITQRSFSHTIMAKEGFLANEISNSIRDAVKNLGTTPAIFFHSAFSLLMSCVSGNRDTVFGSVHSGRQCAPAGSEMAVGMFINTLPIRIDTRMTTSKSLLEYLAKELPSYLPFENSPIKSVMSHLDIEPNQSLVNGVINFRRSVKSLSMSEKIEVLTEEDMMGAVSPLIVAISDDDKDFYLNIKVDHRISIDAIWGLFNAICTLLVNDITDISNENTQAFLSEIDETELLNDPKDMELNSTIEYTFVEQELVSIWQNIFGAEVDKQACIVDSIYLKNIKRLMLSIEEKFAISVDEKLLILNSHFTSQVRYVAKLFMASEFKEEKLHASVQEVGEI